ncbi:MAG: hypothetical protein F4X99_07100 [Gammaproteobacteria bacterium]|nr:hypothetical protein [Gammaproteobacteria bacterium]MYE84498.1 hypothetical protein [Gammaproteobacteria bacterium]
MKTWRFTGALARSALLALILAAGAHAHAEEATVDVNTADAETIARVLDGVGLTKAEAIVRYREENGRFTDAYDLTQVRGIGDATVARNEERIALGD